MSALVLAVTAAGRAAIVNAQNTGTAPVLVSEFGVTDQAFVADSNTAALPGEIKRLTTMSGSAVADDTIHVTIRDDAADVYTIRGFAFYLDDGTLFASYGQVDPIGEKSAQSMFLLALDAIFADIAADSLTFGDTDFLLPPATTEVQGIVELATEAEAEAGADATRAMTPARHKGAVDARFGAGAPSGFVKTLLTAATAIAFRALLAIKGAALYDTGADNGLDADLLDGQHGSYYRAWVNLTGVPLTFPPSAHQHAWADITGVPAYATRWPTFAEVTAKPATYPPSPHSQDWSTILNPPATATRWPGWAEVTGKPVFGTASAKDVGFFVQATPGYWAGSDANTATTSGFYALASPSANTPDDDWTTILSAQGIAGRGFQIANSWNFADDIYWRVNNNGEWTGWRKFWHAGNFDPTTYAKLSGAAFTGNISAPNLSGVNTGDQDLSPYALLAGADFTGPVSAPSYDSTASSRRAKHDIATSRYGLAEVLQMRFVEYRYRPHVVADQRLRFGLIVEELRPVAPELVTEPPESDPDKFPTVDYTQLGPVLGRALQQYIARTDARLAGMSREMAELAARIKLLESRA